MTAPLALEERDEIEALAVEAEDPARLRALLGELIRARSFIALCRRHLARLPRALQQALQTRVPALNAQQRWARTVATHDDDPRLQGAPRLI